MRHITICFFAAWIRNDAGFVENRMESAEICAFSICVCEFNVCEAEKE